MTKTRWLQVISTGAGVALALTIVGVLATPGASEPTATAPPSALTEELAAHGIGFVALEGSEDGAYVPVPKAIDVATREYGVDPAQVAEVFLGSLTQQARLADGTDTTKATVPAPAVAQPAYAVRITGLRLMPIGGPATPDRAHEELIVFVDAATGTEIFATTFR